MAITIKEASNTPLAIAALAKGMADTYVNYSGQRMQDKQYQQGLDRQNRLDIQGQDNWQSTFDANEQQRLYQNEANQNAIDLAARNRTEDQGIQADRWAVTDARADRADDRADTSLGLQQDQFGLQQDQFDQNKMHQDRMHEKSVTDTEQAQDNWMTSFEQDQDNWTKDYEQSKIGTPDAKALEIERLTALYQAQGLTPDKAYQAAVRSAYNTNQVVQDATGMSASVIDKGLSSSPDMVVGNINTQGEYTPSTPLGQAAAPSAPREFATKEEANAAINNDPTIKIGDVIFINGKRAVVE